MLAGRRRIMMRRTLFIALTCLLLAAAPGWADSRRELREGLPVGDSEKVIVDFEVGELRIEAGSGDTVEVELDLRCKSTSSRCERQLDDAEILLEQRGSRLHVGFEGLAKRNSKMEVDAVVRMPAGVALSVDMGIGELRIDGIESDIYVDMGIGEASLSLSESSIRGVYLDTGIGESGVWASEGRARESRPFLIGSEVEWESGAGESEIVVDLGIGEISVHLD
jgi:hypothetical protein